MRTFYENIKVARAQVNPETAIADTTYYPLSGSFIDTRGFEMCTFHIQAGALDTALTFQVRQDTSATVTASVKALTDALEVVGTGDDGEDFLVEFETKKLDTANGFVFVSLYATGGSGSNDYAAIQCYLWNARDLPVTQGSNLPTANKTLLIG